MKNLAEQLKELKQKEHEAWKKYSSAQVKEVNALLKRQGITKEYTLTEILACVKEDREKERLCCVCSPVTQAYYLCKQFTYVNKAYETWSSLGSQITYVMQALEEIGWK